MTSDVARNSQWGMGGWKVWGQSPQPPEVWGSGGAGWEIFAIFQ